jgi:cell division control protein 6
MNFRDILAASTVFINRDALSPHFLPERILHRENEIEKIMRAISPVFNGKKPRNIFIYGKTGTGKTSSVKYISRKFNEYASQHPTGAEINYVNCRIYNTRYKILQKVASDTVAFAKNGFSPSVFYEKILKWVEEKNRFLILVLDEIDVVKDLDELIYTLTRSNDDLHGGGVSLIGISNNLDFKKHLDHRSKSALLETEIVFPPYKAEQLQSILNQRVELGFRERACDASAVNLSAAIAARDTGDARHALKLLLYAGEIADERKDRVVTEQHVELARRNVEEDIVVEAVSTLPEHQQVLLYTLSSLTLGGSKYSRLSDEKENVFMSGELYEAYVDVCKQLKKEHRSARWCKEYLRELESLGLVQMTESGRGIRGHSTLVKISYSPEKIKKVVADLIV